MMPKTGQNSRNWNAGTVTVSSRQISIRRLVFWASVAFWIGNTILHTGSAGITALGSSLLFLVEMVIITSATRTIRLDQLATFYAWGGVMMSVVWLIDYGFTILQPDGSAVSRKLFTPFLEESLKIAPVLYFLWRQRQARLWSMGASDILLLAAASGAGFGLVEDAFIQHHFGLWHAVSWSPTTAILGTGLTVGHQIWTSLAGATLGLALLWRPRQRLGYLLGASGFLWSMLDHFGNNFAVGHRGLVVDFLNFVRGQGWVSLYLYWIALIVVLVADLKVIQRGLPPRPELKIPLTGLLSFSRGAILTWKFLLTKRAMAFVGIHYRQESPSVRKAKLDPVIYRLASTIIALRIKIKSSLHLPMEPSPNSS
jgi:RsiW-degrading membrane proteinase PrsW (M82 family)